MKKPSPRKVLLSTPPTRNHSSPAVLLTKPIVAETVKTPTVSDNLHKSNTSASKPSETPPVNNLAENNFDSAAAVSDLEDISPERASEPDEDPSDPFADFVPEEQEEEVSKEPELKEPEYENFSPEPPVFDDPPEEVLPQCYAQGEAQHDSEVP